MSIKDFIKNKLHKSLYNSAYSRSLYSLFGIVIKEIQVSFKQFFTWKYPIRSFFRTFTIVFSSLMRLLFGRSLKYSFAFTGEDRIIEGIVKPIINKPGYYVDVGCNHPKFLSNTYGLYRKGWTGICIDPNEQLIKKYAYYRPKDIAVAALISNEVEERTFYYAENDVLSTTEESNLSEISRLGLSYHTNKLSTNTLTAVLLENKAPREFDVLSIDAEEHDFKVLISLDFEIFCPKLIIVEDETFCFSSHSDNEFVKFLASKNYIMTGYVLTNAYFVKEDQDTVEQ